MGRLGQRRGAAGTHTPDSASVTIGEAAALWLDRSERDRLEPGTVRQRRQHITLHIVPFLGSEKLSRLTAPRVNRFVEDLRDAGRSPVMRRKILTNLKAVISYAQASGLVAQNVAREVRIKRDTREDRIRMDGGVEMPTKDELRAMIHGAKGRWRPLIITAIFTGMRASELRGLAQEHVDFGAMVIRVRQRADAWGNIGPTKSAAGRRDVPMAPIVANTLRQWLAVCPKGELGLVFPNGKGRVENHQNIMHRGFNPLQVELGIVDEKGQPKYGLHALRHAAVSLFIEQGWTAKRLQTVIGHASMAMTMDTYGKLFRDTEDDRKAMQRIEAALLAPDMQQERDMEALSD